MSIDLFRELDAIAIATPVEKGSFVFSSGDPASAVFVIRTGKVALIWADSKEVSPLDTFGPGVILGLPAALNGEYSATAKAVEDSELGFIPADKVMDMLERSPSHMHATMKLLALEVARIRGIIANAPDHTLLHLVDTAVGATRRFGACGRPYGTINGSLTPAAVAHSPAPRAASPAGQRRSRPPKTPPQSARSSAPGANCRGVSPAPRSETRPRRPGTKSS
jgi:CRP-like cAMP-binding protein